MTAQSQVVAAPHVEEDAHAGQPQGVNTALLGMLLFIGSELMFFAGLFGAYFNTRATAQALAQPWPPEGLEHIINPFPAAPIPYLPVIATTILVLSSVTMQLAMWRIRRGDR